MLLPSSSCLHLLSLPSIDCFQLKSGSSGLQYKFMPLVYLLSFLAPWQCGNTVTFKYSWLVTGATKLCSRLRLASSSQSTLLTGMTAVLFLRYWGLELIIERNIAATGSNAYNGLSICSSCLPHQSMRGQQYEFMTWSKFTLLELPENNLLSELHYAE